MKSTNSSGIGFPLAPAFYTVQAAALRGTSMTCSGWLVGEYAPDCQVRVTRHHRRKPAKTAGILNMMIVVPMLVETVTFGWIFTHAGASTLPRSVGSQTRVAARSSARISTIGVRSRKSAGVLSGPRLDGGPSGTL